MATRRVTLSDVARRAGLSVTAASLILNGRPDTRLSKDAHDRVHAAAAELGYRPNIAARALRTDRTFTLGFVSDHVVTTRFASGLVRGALEAARAADHVMLLIETEGEPDREAEAVAALVDRQVDGIVFATMRAREMFVPELPAGTRALMLNGTNARYGASVLPDEFEGGRRAVDTLIAARGTDGMALLGQSDAAEEGLFRSEAVAQRVAGIRSAMAEHTASFVAEESIWLWEPQHGYDGMTRLLEAAPRMRSLVCMNDRLAFGAYQALADAGRTVPDDIAIVSFDDDELSAHLRPGLTTIALPHEAMGRRAVELLLGDEPFTGTELVPMPLVARASL